MTFDREQWGIVRRSALALVATGLVMGGAYFWVPGRMFGLHDAMSSGDRLVFAVKWNLPVLLWLAYCLRAVSSGRFREPADRKGSAYGEPTPPLAVRIAILQNSLEQTVLAIGSSLLLAAVLRGDELVLIPAAVTLYLAGRVTFASSYPRGAAARAFGMALTAGPLIVSSILSAILIIAGR